MHPLNFPFAIASTVFFLFYCLGLVTFGDHTVKSLVLFALLIAAVGQFMAQDDRPKVFALSQGTTYFAIIIAGFTLLRFVFWNGVTS